MCTAVASGNHIQRKLSEMRQENDCKRAVSICSALQCNIKIVTWNSTNVVTLSVGLVHFHLLPSTTKL